MEFVEEKVLETLKLKTIFFKRYVDDCLAAVLEDKINDILTAFHNFHPKLQFTLEVETNNEINFLVTLLRNKNPQNIKTKWYTKKTWSGLYLNYYSNHPKTKKISVIIGLTDRAITFTSPEFRPHVLKKSNKG